jgi:hypothetical protein
MAQEKIACAFSDYPVRYSSFGNLSNLDPKGSLTTFVPVGTVEYVRKFCEVVGISEPKSFTYPDVLLPYLKRNIRKGFFKDASPEEFVKPSDSVKEFTGDLKKYLLSEPDPETAVWISEPVEFESEFRFYIHDFVNGPEILGWSRYDQSPTTNPQPDEGLVIQMAEALHESLGPSAYCLDIGWRPDLKEYCLVELNDAWALGLYEGSDPQSAPPARKDYADMLVSRWRQVVFCQIV